MNRPRNYHIESITGSLITFIKEIENSELDESVEGKVAKSGEPVMINDTQAEPVNTYPMVSQESIPAFICFPLRSKDKIIGVMNLANREPKPFTRRQAASILDRQSDKPGYRKC